jgi:hypothetical protein
MLGIFINRLKYIKQLFLRLPINKQFSQTTLNINMQFSTVLLALVASFCILDSASAFPAPSVVSEAQLAAGHVQLEKRKWWKKAFNKVKDLASNDAFKSIASTAIDSLAAQLPAAIQPEAVFLVRWRMVSKLLTSMPPRPQIQHWARLLVKVFSSG